MGMIEIRNVPDDLHRALKARAAEAGMTLSAYLRREIEELAERPTLDEMLERIAGDPHVDLPEPAAETIARDRAAMGARFS